MGTVIDFTYTPEFLKSAKVLAKRYKSFSSDLKELLNEITLNPQTGIDLGNGLRKLRMAIKSKGRGKSGGARVITLTIVAEESRSNITLLYVYDKSDMANVSDARLRQIISNNDLPIK
ncbi:MAG: type II toxin-antitoxin system RelE/ParE family toxin [Bacteroidales bacterium]|nr:type II toxin-antitoxin system RelE/ParE family toxin [Bacteroidales bacterium]